MAANETTYDSNRPVPQILLFDRMPGHGGELVDQAIGHPAADRQLVLALELFDGLAGRVIERAGWLDLAVAVIGQHPLPPQGAGGRPDQVGDGIIAPRRWHRHRNGLRRSRHRVRGTHIDDPWPGLLRGLW